MISQQGAINVKYMNLQQSNNAVKSWNSKVMPIETFIEEHPPNDLLSEEIWNVESFQPALYVCIIKYLKKRECIRNYYRKNKEKYNKLNKKWRDNNPDKIRIYKDRARACGGYKKEYYQKNKEKFLKSSREYYRDHKEEIAIKNKIRNQKKKKE